jgi:hypothetical protein
LGTSATLQDDAGNDADLSSLTATVGTSDAIVIDTTAPATPTVDSIKTPDDDATPTITITAEAGSTVAVYANGVELGNATESSTTAGSFSYTSSALVDGNYSVYATSTDTAGNVTESTAQDIIIDTVDPDLPTISSASLSNSAAPTLMGTGVLIQVLLLT